MVIGRGGYITPGAARFDQRVRTSHQVAGILAELVPELGERRLAEIRRAFCARLGPDDPEASAGLVPSFTASRIAHGFDLRGPAYTLDAACASSLLAVEHAVRALRSGQADAMLAGAVHHAQHATVWSVFSPAARAEPERDDPAVRPGRGRDAPRGGDGRRPAEAAAGRPAGRRPGHRGHRRGRVVQRRPRREPAEPAGGRAGPRGRAGLAGRGPRPGRARRGGADRGARHRHPRGRRG
ncbi:hypothetical protein LUX57_13900 [Actinomadura madurae]|nr:beta-ketoacyl synthase N-terminal-like domain-containing protein [Actinomadura madurae]MCP9966066.1 hypothetical protein [Actinomadura madurae]